MARRFSMQNIFSGGGSGMDSLAPEEELPDPSTTGENAPQTGEEEPPVELFPNGSVPEEPAPGNVEEFPGLPPVFPTGPTEPTAPEELEITPAAPVEELEEGNALNTESAALTPGSFSLPGSSSFAPMRHYARALKSKEPEAGLAPDGSFNEDKFAKKLKHRLYKG